MAWIRRLAAPVLVVFSIYVGLLAVSFFIVDSPAYTAWATQSDREAGRLTWADYLEPHPYFAYHDPTVSPGLFEQKNPEEFVILLVGGSFADHLGGALIGNYSRYFKLLEPYTGRKKVRLLKMALPAARQPAGLLQFTLYANVVDAIVAVEGYNELFNDHTICGPDGWTRQFFKHTPEFRERLVVLKARATKEAFLKVSRWKDNGPFTDRINKTLFYAFGKPLSLLMAKWEQDVENEYTAESCSRYPPINGTDQKHLLFWETYTRRIHLLAETMNIPHMTVFQPNLHDKGSKPLSPEELALRDSNSKSLEKAAEYQEARTFFAEKKYSWFYDYTSVYKDTAETLYIDSCCHVNDTGKDIFALQLVKDLAELLKQKSKPRGENR